MDGQGDRRPAAYRFFTPEDRAEGCVERKMERSLKTGRANDERWHLKKDGTHFWANGEMMPLRNGGGDHVGFLKILRDETEKREDAERRRVDREFLDSVLSASDDCIKVLDLDANLVLMREGGNQVMEVDDFERIPGCFWPEFWKDDLNVEAKNAIENTRVGRSGHFPGLTDTMRGTQPTVHKLRPN